MPQTSSNRRKYVTAHLASNQPGRTTAGHRHGISQAASAPVRFCSRQATGLKSVTRRNSRLKFDFV